MKSHETVALTIVIYNASTVKNYNAASSLVRFENYYENAPAHYNAGVVCICKFWNRRIGS
jgi:hypothetical protein